MLLKKILTLDLIMKTTMTFLALTVLVSTSAFAGIITSKNQYFIQTKLGDVPLMAVNKQLKEQSISNIKTYGNAHLISFATNKDTVKLYSVDQKGFIYNIEPYSSYTVASTDESGKFQFNEVPGRKFIVNSKGFYFH